MCGKHMSLFLTYTKSKGRQCKGQHHGQQKPRLLWSFLLTVPEITSLCNVAAKVKNILSFMSQKYGKRQGSKEHTVLLAGFSLLLRALDMSSFRGA